MITPRPQDAIHKAWLYRLLTALADDAELMRYVRFKGGTCAAMLNWLDRFSVDLDFDIVAPATGNYDDTFLREIRSRLERHFTDLGLHIKDSSQRGVQYFLRYDAPPGQRNTIKVEGYFPPPQANVYAPEQFIEIDRTITCQSTETMFAHKLVAPLDRWEQHGSIAGRDVYDIHYFFLHGFRYNSAVITERRNTELADFFKQLISFVDRHITGTILQQDLNPLLEATQLQKVGKTLKSETLIMLRDELQRLQ